MPARPLILHDPKYAEPAFWLAAIWRDLPGFTRDDGARGSNRGQPRRREPGNCSTERKTMTVLEETKSKNSSGATRSGRLFVLELSGDRIHSRLFCSPRLV